jgi:putative peptide zinc metalloprotease protein
MLADPYLLLPVLAVVLVSGFFHELGHAAGCRYSGGRAGAVGFGVYIVWPAFYTDVTDAYRLGRGGRLRTDLGGVYFNAITVLLLGGGYLLTHFPPLLIAVVVIQYQMISQMLPLVRLDGYYILGDLLGVHDLFGRVRPVLRSLIPGRPVDPRVRELKVGVRLVVGVWVLVIVPFLAVNLALLLVYLPTIVIQTQESISREVRAIALAVTSSNVIEATAAVVNILILMIAAAGIVLLLARSTVQVVRVGLQRSRGRLQMRIGLAAAGLTPLILLLTTWWKTIAR